MSEIIDTTSALHSAATALSELLRMTNAYLQATELATSLLRSRDGFKALLAQTEEKLEASRKQLADIWTEPNPTLIALEQELASLLQERDLWKAENESRAEALRKLHAIIGYNNDDGSHSSPGPEQIAQDLVLTKEEIDNNNTRLRNEKQQLEDQHADVALENERLMKRITELEEERAEHASRGTVPYTDQSTQPIKRGPGRPPKNA